MGLLDHKTAVITGANSGIGLATAERFIAEGADRVFITGRRQSELSAAATQLGSRAVAVPGDVSADHIRKRPTFICRHCGAPMLVIETFARATHIRGPPP